jgi:2-oxo-4-hydroxy-4-carboxy--5-ureidoimidazoline (OHCU) decarboxylase
MNYDWNNEAEFLALNGEYDEMFNVAFNKFVDESAKQGNKDALHNLKEIRKDTPLDDYVTQQRA